MSAIPNLSNLSNISRLGSVRRPNKKAYLFDGVNDYIAGDTTIGRTGYDMSVLSGNIYTGSDADGSYMYFQGNRDGTAATGTKANMGNNTTPSYTQANNITIKCRVKFIAFAPNNVGGVFGSNNDFAMHIETGTSKLRYTVRGSTNVNYDSGVISLNTLYDAYLVYDASNTKFYCYISSGGAASTLLNVGGTSGPATFTANSWYMGDDAIGAGTSASNNMYIYHAAIRNVALTQAEIDADIALGNTTKTDSRIVAYYIPENLQYNTQYIANPTDLTNATWTKGANTTITGDYATAPDGTMTADRVVRTGVGGLSANKIERTFTTLSGSLLASKTFIVKAFVRAVTTTKTFRLRCSHSGVADYYSSDQTATSVRQEFTFTQTFTSSSSGTGITGGLVSDTGVAATDLEVRNVRVFLTNEVLPDESPNIGGYIGRKTEKVVSAWVKIGADAAGSTTDTQTIALSPRYYIHIRTTNNTVQCRFDTRQQARIGGTDLGNGFRGWVHIMGRFGRNGTSRQSTYYLNGVSTSTGSGIIDPSSTIYSTTLWSGRRSSSYYTGYIRELKIYTGTSTFSASDALAVYKGLSPSVGSLYLHWRPTPGEAGTTTIDHAGNSRTGTLNGGVTRPFLSGS